MPDIFVHMFSVKRLGVGACCEKVLDLAIKIKKHRFLPC